ncbi:MAG TPA: EamA family transporter [Cytophagales bacterium]|nr:EamA family transporter [Cytophagales bacterium]
MTENRKNLLPYLALAVVCIAWGTTYLALRIGVLEFPAFLFSGLRQLIAGILLTGVLLTVGKLKLPSKSVIINQAIGGFFMITMGNGLVGWAEIHVSSGVAAIICSMVPIWVILINLLIAKEEKPTFPIIMGMAIGLSGIILIFGENITDFTNAGYTLGIIMIFIANLGWAGGSIWMKRKNQHSDPFLNAGLQMVFGGLFLMPVSLVFDNYETIQWSNNVIYSLVYLILVGSVAAYACYSYAIKNLPITIVTLYAYINPIVAIVLGWLVLGEKLNLRIVIAIGVTLAGIYIVNRGYQLRNLWRSQFSTNPE